GIYTWEDGGGISNIVEDITPQLGGNLDAQTNDITNVGTITADNFIDSDGTTASSGTVLDLSDNITGQIFNHGTPSTASNFTLANIKRGGSVTNFIDTTGK